MIPLPGRRFVPAAATVLILLVALVAGAWYLAKPATASVRGVLLDVQSASLILATQVTLRDEQGRIWVFAVDPQVSNNPEQSQSASHLRSHMALADPVIVRYRTTTDGPLALRILDAE